MTRETAIIIVWAMSAETMLRGIDYVMGDGPNVTRSLTFIEAAAPLWFWGALGLVAATCTTYGLIRRQYEPVIAGATLGFSLYATFGVGLSATVFERGWPPDGFRTPGMFFVYAFIWLLIAIEMYVGRDATRTVSERTEHGPDTRGDIR